MTIERIKLIDWLIVLIVIFRGALSETNLSLQNEICNSYSGRRIYMELGEQGTLQATNVVLPTTPNKFAKIERLADGTASIRYQCQLELITCSSCVVELTITYTNFTEKCNPRDKYCQCNDYMSFTEPPYEEPALERKWCGDSSHVIRSNSRVLVISYVYSSSRTNVFNLTYASKKNQIQYFGSPSNATLPQSNTLMSPFFPSFYPRDLVIEHVFKCNDTDSDDCRLEFTFSDFQISETSAIEFYDGDEQLIAKYTGEIFRPPIIYSNDSTVIVRFFANGGTGLGYRANVQYITQAQLNQTVKPFTDCGGMVESFGGAITMMNMVNDNTSDPKRFNCIWVIKPPNSYMHLKTHLLMRIDTFESMAETSSVTIRDGLTSDATFLQEYRWPLNKSVVKPFQSFVTSLSSGFYVSFNGVFGADSRFAIVYTAFSYMDCFPGSEFLCENHRCIPFYLQCDGFDHCGDSSDEIEHCSTTEVTDADSNQYWYTHAPNYFFPKMDHYPDLKTAALVFLASAMSLIMLILLLIVILYRMNSHVREQRELQSQLRTISELLDNNANEHTEENDAALEMPPAYEHPPDYDEASSVKINMNSRRSSRADGNRKRRRSRSRSRCSVQADQNSLLNISISGTPIPTDILIPELFLTNDYQSLPNTNVIECAISSRNSRRRSESAAVHSRRNSQILLIPESPPPEYTPVHTIMESSHSSDQFSSNFMSIVVPNINQLNSTVKTNAELQEHSSCGNQLDVNQNFVPFMPRRHSSQEDRPCQFFEQQIMNHLQQSSNSVVQSQLITNRKENGCFHPSAINWLKNFNLVRNKIPEEITSHRHFFKATLRKTSSENELLLMSQSSEHELNGPLFVRRSFSSGLLF